MTFKNEDEVEFRKYFFEVLDKYNMGDPYTGGIPRFIFDKDTLKEKHKCFIPFFYVEIDSNGNVFSCCHHEKFFGNLKQNTLMEIFNGNEMQNFRKLVKDGRNKCICWYNPSIFNAYMPKILKVRKHVPRK